MPTILTETDTYPSAVWGPSAGDAVAAATMRSQMTDVNNRIYYVRNRIVGLVNNSLQVPVIGGFDGGGGHFSFAALGTRLGALQYNVGAAGEWHMPLVLPTNIAALTRMFIKRVRARFYVDTGRGSLPTTFPRIELWRQATSGASGYTIPIAESIPTPGSVGAYEVGAHTTSFGTTGTSTTTQLTTDYHYWAVFKGETGGGAMANKLALLGVDVEIEQA